MGSIRRAIIASGITALLLAGCSGGRKHTSNMPVPPPVRPDRAPEPPMGASAGLTVPGIGADGRRITPNRGLSSAGSIWHVRMALNVAALSCNQQGGAARISYNALLKTHKTALARANAAVDGEYKAAYGASGMAMRDTLSTKVYNFFALPPVQPGFCARAIPVAEAFNTRKSSELADYAPQALALLEQPYLDFYEAYAAYQRQLEGWRATQRASQASGRPGGAP